MKQTFICEYCGKIFSNYSQCEECEKECRERIDNQKSFGDRLAMFRQAKGISQNALAALTGIGQSLISLYEVNKVLPNVKTVKALCEVLNVTATELLGY